VSGLSRVPAPAKGMITFNNPTFLQSRLLIFLLRKNPYSKELYKSYDNNMLLCCFKNVKNHQSQTDGMIKFVADIEWFLTLNIPPIHGGS
jgi:hypothetical protein